MYNRNIISDSLVQCILKSFDLGWCHFLMSFSFSLFASLPFVPHLIEPVTHRRTSALGLFPPTWLIMLVALQQYEHAHSHLFLNGAHSKVSKAECSHYSHRHRQQQGDCSYTSPPTPPPHQAVLMRGGMANTNGPEKLRFSKWAHLPGS